ncbi:hypothetical protein FE634_15480 [Nocardioides dongxiaopingii]|uniref:hypothetical protein n=1 Tax=Nocardioides sp. S-1144 TaxID=2582905 RepID=UPI00110E85BB|nr:hypothetical protein [Nocardioides sp. S-1144]QCW51460.1 hypothetical protein FE634_15480 [Nocardioides sp. S-1144]
MSALTEAGAQRAAVEIARLLATGTRTDVVKDHLLRSVTGGPDHTATVGGIEALLSIAVAAADLFRGALDVFAAEPGGPTVLALLDAQASILANEP